MLWEHNADNLDDKLEFTEEELDALHKSKTEDDYTEEVADNASRQQT